jgi:LacI family transcriptional regulator
MELSIPEKVSLICFDDADWTAAVTPPLTVVSQPIKELATTATEDLIARLQREAKAPGKETLLQATLIDRGSVGRALATPCVERQ